jgi:hypothetical protein
VQGALNAVSATPNVLSERLTTGRVLPGTILRDRARAAVAGPRLGIAAIPVLSVVAPAAGHAAGIARVSRCAVPGRGGGAALPNGARDVRQRACR